MANRRLYHDQPASFAFNEENAAWAEVVVRRYPPARRASAVIPLLWRGQEQVGWVTKPMIESIADMLGMAYIRVLEVATFYTMFQLAPVGTKAHIQVCGTTPCMLRGAEDLISICKSRIAPHAHELNADGSLSWEEVECLGACVNAPMVQVFKDTYEDLTPESFNLLIDGFAAGNPPQPGPQNGRQFAAAEGGETTLTDAALYDGSVIGKHRAYAIEPVPAPAAPAPAPAAAAPAAPAPAKPAEPAPKPAEAPAAKAPEPAPAAAETAETVSDEFKPELLKSARDGKPDDLKLISGVGPKLEAMLNEMGVYHFDQIAEWNDDNLRWVDQHLGSFKGRAVRDKWIEQARGLRSGGGGSAASSGGAVGFAAVEPVSAPAPSSGGVSVPVEADEPVSDEFKPVLLTQARDGGPDDLKLIWGVGPKLEAMLHGMGVFHFDQIADWTDENLRWVDQNLGSFKGRAVRDKWIQQAEKLKTGWRPTDPVGDKPV